MGFSIPICNKSFAQCLQWYNANMLNRLFVYGLFDSNEKCLYIGRTERLRRRKYTQERRFKNAEFRLLYEGGPEASTIEKWLIARFFELGQAQHNKSSQKWIHPALRN
jgi:hypothetical protein